VKVIWHEKHQFKIPDALLIVHLRGFEDLLGGPFSAKLISPFCIAAQRNEIGRTKAPGEVNAMIEGLPNEPFHAGGTQNGD